jgi:hypothetical protein
MNKILLLFLTILSSLNFSFGQNDVNSIRMLSEYSSKDKVLSDFLFLEKIDHYQIRFVGEKLKNKHFWMVKKEVWNGNVSKTDTLVSASKVGGIRNIVTDDTLKVRVIGKSENKKLKMFFRFPRFGFGHDTDGIDSKDYSLRDIGTHANIELNKPFYALAYILPYEKDGSKMYCEVDFDPDIINWGKKFEIEHYILFEMMFW